MSTSSVLTAVFVYSLFSTFAILIILAIVGKCLGWSDPSAPTQISSEESVIHKEIESARYRESFSNIRQLRSLKYKSQKDINILKSKTYVLDKWKYHSSVRVSSTDELSSREQAAQAVMQAALNPPKKPVASPSKKKALPSSSRSRKVHKKVPARKVVPISNTMTTTTSTTRFNPWKLGWTTTITTVSTEGEEENDVLIQLEKGVSESDDQDDGEEESNSQLLSQTTSPQTPNKPISDIPLSTTPLHSQDVTNPPLDLSNRIDNLESLLVGISEKINQNSLVPNSGTATSNVRTNSNSETVSTDIPSNSSIDKGLPLSTPDPIRTSNLSLIDDAQPIVDKSKPAKNIENKGSPEQQSSYRDFERRNSSRSTSLNEVDSPSRFKLGNGGSSNRISQKGDRPTSSPSSGSSPTKTKDARKDKKRSKSKKRSSPSGGSSNASSNSNASTPPLGDSDVEERKGDINTEEVGSAQQVRENKEASENRRTSPKPLPPLTKLPMSPSSVVL